MSSAVSLLDEVSFANDLAKSQDPIDFYNREDLKALKSQGYDLSKLEPTADYYESRMGSIDDLNNLKLKININENGTVLLNSIPSLQGIGTFRLIVSDEKGKSYKLFFGPRSHNQVLRSALLRMLGYKVKGIKHLLKLNVKLESADRAITLLNKLGTKITHKNSNRWITNIKRINTVDEKTQKTEFHWVLPEEEDLVLKFQDVVLMEANNQHLEIEETHISEELNDEYRSINALLIPASLADIPESINMYSTQPGKIIDNTLFIQLSDQENPRTFRPSLDDAKWITRKISSLSREQFRQIVSQVQYPTIGNFTPVQDLLIEKMIAARNWYRDILLGNDPDCEVYKSNHIETNFWQNLFGGPVVSSTSPNPGPSYCQVIPTNLKISDSSGWLTNGKLTKQTDYEDPSDVVNPDKWYVGWGSRFSFKEDESPISWDQIQSLLWTILSTNLQSHLVSQVNKELPRTDISEIAFEKTKQAQLNAAVDCVFDSSCNSGGSESGLGIVYECIDNHTCDPKFDVWSTNFYGIDLINSRSVVFGSFFGTDNKIQLSETFGYGINAGRFFGTVGLDPGQLVSAQLKLSFVHTWTNIMPLESINSTLENEYHFKLFPTLLGLFVPYRKYKSADSLNTIASGELSELDNTMLPENDENGRPILDRRSPRQLALDGAIENFKKDLIVGQSFVISDNLGMGGSLKAGKFYSNEFALTGGFGNDLLELGRFHINRKSDSIYHIYFTEGLVNHFSAGIQAALKIPILDIIYSAKDSVQLAPSCQIHNFDQNSFSSPTELKKLKDQALRLDRHLCPPETKVFVLELKSVKEYLEELRKHKLSTLNPSFSDDEKARIDKFMQSQIKSATLLFEILRKPTVKSAYEALLAFQAPDSIQHNFSERNWQFRFFQEESLDVNSQDDLTVTSAIPDPEDQTRLSYERRLLYTHRDGKRSGRNWQRLAQELAQEWINENFEKSDIEVDLPNNGKPGDTFKGSSYTRKQVFETEVDNYYAPGELINPLHQISYQYKGWSVDFDGLYKILSELNQKYGDHFINIGDFAPVDDYQLYNITVTSYLYEEGIYALAELDIKFAEELFKNAEIKIYAHQRQMAEKRNISYDELEKSIQKKALRSFLTKQKILKKALFTKNKELVSESLINIIDQIEPLFSFSDFQKFFGNTNKSKDNMYTVAMLNGFKSSVEGARTAISGLSIGQVGSEKYRGPIHDIRSTLLQNMSESEMLLLSEMEFF